MHDNKSTLVCSVLIVLVLALYGPNIHSAFAVPKVKPCKPYDKNICVEKTSIPKKFRSSIPSTLGKGYLTPLIKTNGLAGTLPSTTPGPNVPYILIPAGLETITLCTLSLAGEYSCTVLTRFKECPIVITYRDEGSGITYTCDLDCDNRRPNGDADSNGNCDCDIKQDTCRQGFN